MNSFRADERRLRIWSVAARLVEFLSALALLMIIALVVFAFVVDLQPNMARFVRFAICVVIFVTLRVASEYAKRTARQIKESITQRVTSVILGSGTAAPNDLRVVLFLRSFEDDQFIGHAKVKDELFVHDDVWENEDGEILQISKSPFYKYDVTKHERGEWELESTLAKRLEGYANFIAIGSDSYEIGASRIRFDENGWRDGVLRFMHSASVIICVPGATPGTEWEVDQIVEDAALREKTIFVNPGNCFVFKKKRELFTGWLAQDKAHWERLQDAPQTGYWTWIREVYKKRHGYEFPKFEPFGKWFILGANGVADRQQWSASPVTDFLILCSRRNLLKLKR